MQHRPPAAGARGHLLRVLGFGFALAVVIGGTVGIGILRSPALVAQGAGTPGLALALWAAGGLFALFAAAAFVELGTSLPRSGGVYVFAHRALGDAAGFAFGCADLFSTCCSIAFAALGCAEFTALLWPTLAPHAQSLAMLLVMALLLVQLCGIRVSSAFEQAGTALKALAFIALIVGLLVFAEPAVPGAVDAPARAAVPAASLLGIALALQLVLGAYDGWAGGVYFAGEDRAPGRNLPRAIFGGVLLVTLVYLAMNVALLHTLSFEQLAASPLPAADAARAWLGDRGARGVTAIAALSMLPLLSGVLLVASRIAHAMASDGLLPARLAMVDHRGAPVPALVGCAAIGVALIAAAGGTLNVVIGAGALLAILSYIGGFLALLVLRRREPELPRPFRAWGAPYSTVAVLLVCIALAVGAVPGAPRESLIALVLLGASYPVYRLRRARLQTAADTA